MTVPYPNLEPTKLDKILSILLDIQQCLREVLESDDESLALHDLHTNEDDSTDEEAEELLRKLPIPRSGRQ